MSLAGDKKNSKNRLLPKPLLSVHNEVTPTPWLSGCAARKWWGHHGSMISYIPYYYTRSLYGPDMSRLPFPISKLASAFRLLTNMQNAVCCASRRDIGVGLVVLCSASTTLQVSQSITMNTINTEQSEVS